MNIARCMIQTMEERGFRPGSEPNNSLAARQTSSTVTRVMQRWSIGHSRSKHGLHSTACLTTRVLGPYGPVTVSSVEPNIASVDTPSAAAMCMGPESFVIINDDSANRPISVSNDVFPLKTAAAVIIRSQI